VKTDIEQVEKLLGIGFEWEKSSGPYNPDSDRASPVWQARRGGRNFLVKSLTDRCYVWKIFMKGSWTAPQKLIHESSSSFETGVDAIFDVEKFAYENNL